MTTPTGPTVASVSVAVTPNTSTFNADLQAALRRAVDAVSDAADSMGDQIAQGITSGVIRARLALATLGEGLEDRVRTNASLIGNLTGGLLSLGGTAVKTGAQLGALGLAAGSAAFSFGALLGAVADLSGIAVALPAVIGSAALVMGTLKLATQGVGEAFAAGLSGDMEAFTEAAKDLAPAAQQVVSVAIDMDKRFDALKKTVQQNFFAPIATNFRGFVEQGTKLAESALPRISTELGKIAGEFLNVARTGTFFSGLQELVNQTVSGLQRWQGVTGEVANALGNLFKVGAGFSGDLIAGVGVLIKQFATWINTASATGELQERLQNAIDAFASLGRIVGNIGKIFGAFWSAAQDSGAGFLSVIEGITQQLATFVNSDAGISALTSLMNAGGTAAAILGDAIGRLLPIVGNLVLLMSTTLVSALETVAPALRQLIDGIGLFAESAGPGVSSAIVMLARGLSGLMTSLAPLLPVLGEIVGLLAEHFASVVNIAASVLGDFLDALAPVLPEIKELISAGLESFTDALTMVADALVPILPVLIELGTTILRLVVTAFDKVIKAVEPLLPVLTELAVKILTMAVDHFANLLAVIEPLIPVIIDLVSKGLEVLADILPVVLETFKPLLPIVVDIAKRLGDSLAPVLPAIVEGFKEIFKALEPVLPQLVQLAGDVLVSAAQLFTALVQAILPLVPPLIQIGTEILSVLVPAFTDLMTALTPILPVLSELAVQILQDALLPILQAILPLVPTLVEAFVELLPSVVLLLPPLVDLAVALTPLIVLLADLTNVILKVLLPAIEIIIIIIATRLTFAFLAIGAVIDAFKVIVQIAWDAIVSAIQLAWTIIKGIFDIIISLLQGDFSEAWRRLQRLVGDVWEQISGFVSRTLGRILQYIAEWGPKVWRATFDALAAVVGVFSDKGAEFVRSIGDNLTKVVQWFTGIANIIRDSFSRAWDWLYDLGKNVIQGFINGLVDKAQDLYNKLQGIIDKAKSLWDSATGWFTGSPSKWTMQRGKWVVEGFADGLESQQSLAVNASQDLIDATKRPFDTTFSASVPNMSAMMGTLGTSSPANDIGTQSTVITFGQGSVMVSFEGVVPSEADALMTGQAVGRGILDMIAQRDAQLAVRVL